MHGQPHIRFDLLLDKTLRPAGIPSSLYEHTFARASSPSLDESVAWWWGGDPFCLRSLCVGDVTDAEVRVNILKAAGTSLWFSGLGFPLVDRENPCGLLPHVLSDLLADAELLTIGVCFEDWKVSRWHPEILLLSKVGGGKWRMRRI